VLLDLAAAGAAAAPNAAPGGDTSWFAPLTNTLEAVLKQIQGGLDRLHVPYSYGYSIILLTVFVKALTFPLTKKQASLHGSPTAHVLRACVPQTKQLVLGMRAIDPKESCGGGARCCRARARPQVAALPAARRPTPSTRAGRVHHGCPVPQAAH
jgi:YidC/Oxa1 family membrane protein insertase